MPLLFLWVLSAAVGRPDAPRDQVLVVTTAEWTSDAGTAVLVEDGRVALGPVAVRLGWAGLGWGRGLHPDTPLAGPKKKEGDGRSPAGVFRVGATWRRLLGATTWCVDDEKSNDYAKILTIPPTAPRTFSSAEWMADYRVAVVVEHNPGRVKSGGSCIFLHDGTEPTVGCTAFAPDGMDALTRRLRPGARIAQLPAASYKTLADAWDLPPPRLIGLD